MFPQGEPSRKTILNRFPAAECHADISSSFILTQTFFCYKFYLFVDTEEFMKDNSVIDGRFIYDSKNFQNAAQQVCAGIQN